MKARRVLYLGSAVLVGLGVGIGSAWWAVGGGMSHAIQCGAWRHYPYYGSSSANPYVRARTQLAGPLALDRSEAIYWIPTGGGKRFELFLRLYSPTQRVLEDARMVELPRIIREGLADE